MPVILSRVDREAMNTVEGSALKISLAARPKIVILSVAKDLLLHFMFSGGTEFHARLRLLFCDAGNEFSATGH